MLSRTSCIYALLFLGVAPTTAEAQADPIGSTGGATWNDERSTAIARLMIEARYRSDRDSTLRSFSASAQGHVYFLGEFGDTRNLARADQVALEVLWQTPDRAMQTIVGRRDEKRLPTDIRYHIDHLSIILDNFGDRISFGEGEEVLGVLHPAAAGAADSYDYRLVDSLSIQFDAQPHMLYRLQVRPRDSSIPALVGSVDVDAASGAIARLAFTFTAAAYRDYRLDFVNVDLRSGLFEGRWWLPVEQHIEIRRQLAWLDYPVAGVIRTRFSISDYRFNEATAYTLARGQRIATLPPEALAAFDGWESSLADGPAVPADRADVEWSEVRSVAAELVGPEMLFGGSRVRVYAPGASSVIRTRRAEGLLLGAGVSFDATERREASVWGGYAFGRAQPEVTLRFAAGIGPVDFAGALHLNRLADVGPFQVASGTGSSFSVLFQGEDFTDPYFEDGGEVSAAVRALGGRATLGFSYLGQDSGELVIGTQAIDGNAVRPVRPIDEGDLAAVQLGLDREFGNLFAATWRLSVSGEAGLRGPGDFGFSRVLAVLRVDAEGRSAPWGWEGLVALGIGGGQLPAQRLFLLGGRGTLGGYGFREWGGDRMALVQAGVSRAIVAPWVRLRALGAAGSVGLGDAGVAAAERFGAVSSDGVRSSVGFGLGIFYDLVRIDALRGLRGGEWQLFASINPALWPML